MCYVPLPDAFTVMGFGFGQTEIIAVGLVISALLVVGYRLITHRKKYARD